MSLIVGFLLGYFWKSHIKEIVLSGLAKAKKWIDER